MSGKGGASGAWLCAVPAAEYKPRARSEKERERFMLCLWGEGGGLDGGRAEQITPPRYTQVREFEYLYYNYHNLPGLHHIFFHLCPKTRARRPGKLRVRVRGRAATSAKEGGRTKANSKEVPGANVLGIAARQSPPWPHGRRWCATNDRLVVRSTAFVRDRTTVPCRMRILLKNPLGTPASGRFRDAVIPTAPENGRGEDRWPAQQGWLCSGFSTGS